MKKKEEKRNEAAINETREVFQSYEKCLKMIVTSGICEDSEEKSLLFFPKNNLVIEKKVYEREDGEQVEPSEKEKLPLFAKKAVEFFKSPRVKVIHPFKKFTKLDRSGIEYKHQKFEVDKGQEKREEGGKGLVLKKESFIVPSISKTRKIIKKNLTPQFFHIFDKLRSENEFDWAGGSELKICKRESVKQLRDLDETSFILQVTKFETSFQEKWGDIEPLFLSMALYDMEKKVKITEEFYFDFNEEETLSLITMGVKYTEDQFKNSCLFRLPYQSEDIVLVVILNKVLEGKEDSVCERYVKPNLKESELKKIKKNIRPVCDRMGFLRQPICYTMLQVFDDGDELILGEKQPQIWYRTYGNVNILNFFSEDYANKQKATGSRKIKTVKANINLEVIPISDSYKLTHEKNGMVNINGKFSIRQIVSFPYPQHEVKYEFNRKYSHVLYVYPTQFKYSSSKNITIRVQVKKNDKVINDKNTLPLIFGQSSQDLHIRTAYTKVTYKKKSPEFNDEIKIALPALLTPDHHLLFSFYHVVAKFKTNKPTLSAIGHCCVPIVNQDGKIINGKKQFAVVTDYLNNGNHYRKKGMIKKEMDKAFRVRFNCLSTIYPTDANMAKFFANPMTKVHAIEKAFVSSPMSVIENIPEIFNSLIEILTGDVFENKILLDTFKVMVNLVDQISVYMEQNERCKLLWDFIENYFTNPKKVNSTPFFQIAFMWDTLIKNGQNRRKALGKGGAFLKSLQYSWFFFEIIYKSIVLYLKENQINERLNDKNFTNVLKQLVNGLSVEACYRVKELTLVKTMNNKLGLFLRDLFNVMDRGTVLVLVDVYLEHLNQIQKHKELVQELRMAFCKVIGDFEHFVPLSLPRSFQITGIGIEKRLCDLSFLCGIIIRQAIRDITDRERTVRERCFELMKEILTKHEYDKRFGSEKMKKRIAGMCFPYVLLFLEKYDGFTAIVEEKMREYETQMKDLKDQISSKEAHLSQTKINLEQLKDEDQKNKLNLIIKKIDGELRKVVTESKNVGDLLEEERNKVRAEKQSAFITLISICYSMDRITLLKWVKTEVRTKVVTFFRLLYDAVKLFEYRGKKIIRDMDAKYGIGVSSNKNLQDTKSEIEKLYSFNSLTGSLKSRSRTTRLMRRDRAKKVSRLSLGRSLKRGSISRTSFNQAPKLDPEEMKKRIGWEGTLSATTSYAIIDIMIDLIKKIEWNNELLNEIFQIIALFFTTNQSERVLRCFFPFLQCFIEIYRSRLFLNETSFSERICLELMKKCYSSSKKVRSRAAACLYLLIKFNYLEMGNFTRTKIQTTTMLSGLVTDLSERHVIFLDMCFSKIADYAEGDNEVKLSKQLLRKQKKKAPIFPEQVKGLVSRLQTTLLDTRKISEYKDDIALHEKLVELFIRLGIGAKDNAELSVTWYNNLSDFHKKKKKYVEAGIAKLYIAAFVFQYFLLKDDVTFTKLDYNLLVKCAPPLKRESFKELKDLFRESSPTFASRYFTYEGFVDLLKEAIDLFDEAKHFEFKVSLFKLLEQFYLQFDNYGELQIVYSELSKCCRVINNIRTKGQSRFFGSYYLLSFYGSKWPSEKNGKTFIYKFPKLCKLSDVIDYIHNTYDETYGKENIKISSSSKEISEDKLKDRSKVFCLIQSVRPYKENLKKEATYFEKNVDVEQFIFETPFTKGIDQKSGKKKKNIGILEEQFKRKTILITEANFPGLEIKSKIKEKKEIILGPIENAIEIIEKSLVRLKEFQKDETKERIDVNSLQMVLFGIIIPQVQEGIPGITKTFLTDKYLNSNDDETCNFIFQLKEKLKVFLGMCLFGIKLNEKYCNMTRESQFDICVQFIKGYFKLYCLISSKVEGCEPVGKLFFKYLNPDKEIVFTKDLEVQFKSFLDTYVLLNGKGKSI